jgi:hypothetical protein
MIRGDKPFTAAYDGQMALDPDELHTNAATTLHGRRQGSQVMLID